MVIERGTNNLTSCYHALEADGTPGGASTIVIYCNLKKTKLLIGRLIAHISSTSANPYQYESW